MQPLNTNSKRGHIRESALSGRIASLLKIFGDGEPHKAAALAQHIGVNSRTIRRTLHLMRDEMGIPLIAGRDGFLLENAEAMQEAMAATGPSVAVASGSNARFWNRSLAPQHN